MDWWKTCLEASEMRRYRRMLTKSGMRSRAKNGGAHLEASELGQFRDGSTAEDKMLG